LAKEKRNPLITIGAVSAVAAVAIFVLTTRSPNATSDTAQVAEVSEQAETTAKDAPKPAGQQKNEAPAAPVASEPAAAQTATGTLTITCKPQCINVRMGDEMLGPGPLLKKPFPAGTHRLTLIRQGMSPSVVEVDILAGQHVSRSFNLTAPASGPAAAPAPKPETPEPEPQVEDDPYENEKLPVAPGETPPPPLPVAP
jgi:hypothetical protein